MNGSPIDALMRIRSILRYQLHTNSICVPATIFVQIELDGHRPYRFVGSKDVNHYRSKN